MEEYYVYIMASYSKVIYIGVTNDLQRRVYEHKFGCEVSFCSKYNVNKLVYFETYHDIDDAIDCEKMLKKWRREKKVNLIEKDNPLWKDLAIF